MSDWSSLRLQRCVSLIILNGSSSSLKSFKNHMDHQVITCKQSALNTIGKLLLGAWPKHLNGHYFFYRVEQWCILNLYAASPMILLQKHQTSPETIAKHDTVNRLQATMRAHESVRPHTIISLYVHSFPVQVFCAVGTPCRMTSRAVYSQC